MKITFTIADADADGFGNVLGRLKGFYVRVITPGAAVEGVITGVDYYGSDSPILTLRALAGAPESRNARVQVSGISDVVYQ